MPCRRASSSASSRSIGPLRIKLGIDPTTADMHLGHTVVLRQAARVPGRGPPRVLIIGDYTARVGDPTGRSKTRPVLSGEEIDANARTYQEQASRSCATIPSSSRSASTASGWT